MVFLTNLIRELLTHTPINDPNTQTNGPDAPNLYVCKGLVRTDNPDACQLELGA